ncbi:MAG TPA: hypothetical protein VFK31_01710 [Rhodanobacteraceae bacterium]|jgi:hypothetical protein|nr:hypothetical protein [Rhodanobacteraceae bacterium]
MQGTDTMTLESKSADAPRTTAAGLEAWMGMSAAPAKGVDFTAVPELTADAAAPLEEVGPVNAAEAIVLGALANARKLVGIDGAELVVDPEKDAYYFESTSLKPLESLLQQPTTNWTPVYTEALKSVGAAQTAQPLERLRWFAGLVATPGILGRRLVSGARYKLARWPETEREFPRHFRIAKAMSKEPATVEEIAAASGTSLEEVTDYVNACHAAGRLDDTHTSSQAATPPPAEPRTRGRLMARLSKPLFAR